MSSRVVRSLLKQTEGLVRLFQERVSSLYGQKGALSIVRMDDTDYGEVMLGDGLAVGIDGSMDYDERIEMLLFYVSATGYNCPFKTTGRDIEFMLRETSRDSSLSVSAAVPLWLEDLSTVTQGASALRPEHEFKISIERIPYSLMTMAEIYLAYLAGLRDEVKIIFLDRPLSGTHASLAAGVRELLDRVVKRGEPSPLLGLDTPHGKLAKIDLRLASIIGPGSIHIPLRQPYLSYAVVKWLLEKREATFREIRERFGIVDDKKFRGLVKKLEELDSGEDRPLFDLFDKTGGYVRINPEVVDYWDRVFYVTREVVDRIFVRNEHPFHLGKNRWLSVYEIDMITLCLFYEMINLVKRAGKLVIGITKDTAATDFTRAVIPYMKSLGIVDEEAILPTLKNDRAYLSIMSSVNVDSVKTPWRTIAYDSCFFTLVENRDGETPLRTARKVISRERMFIKSYFQTRSFKRDKRLRSLVFAYDRIYDEKYDDALLKRLKVANYSGKVIEVDAFFEGDKVSPIDQLVLRILSKTDNPEVLESFGHNHLLYLADKAVKVEVRNMRTVLRKIADLQLGTLAKRERIPLIMRRFRDMRADMEHARQRAAYQSG